MGQIFSKCLGSRRKRETQPEVLPTPIPFPRTNEPIAHPPGEASLPGQSTRHPLAVAIPPSEPIAPLSQTTAPAPKTGVVSSRERRAQLLNPAPPVPDHYVYRNFWGEAVKILPKESRLPKEWRGVAIDRESLIAMVKDKMEECKDKQWTIRIGGEEVILREVFGKTLDWIQKFVAVGDTAVQYDPVNAALPWAGFRFLLQVAVNDRETYGAMLAALERATWLASYCSAQEYLYKEYFADNNRYSDLNDAFLEDLVHLYAAILNFLIQAHNYYAQGSAVRFMGGIIRPSSWVMELRRAIDDHRGRMEDYASLVHKSNVHQNLKDMLGMLEPFSEYVSEAARRRKDKDRRAFLNWLSDIDYRGDHEANSRNILKGSGDWVLRSEEKFRSWKQRGGLLWLCGIPGAGKTKLTSTIINHLTSTDENHTVAYFYCLRDTKQPKKEDPEEILRAILKQLVIILPSRLSAPVRAKYEEEQKQGSDHGSVRTLTFKECAHFIVELATSRSVTIVIDALDECRETKDHSFRGSHTDRQDLLKVLMATKDNNVRVFLSSRDDLDIKRRLERYPTIAMNASKNGGDILRLIESDVDDLMTNKGDWGCDETLREDIIMAVSHRANGMFRFAALQIGYFSTLNTRHGVRQRLRNLPTTIVQLYDEIYGRISVMVDEESSIAKRALSWLLCAYRQLSSSELLAAVSPTMDVLVNEDELLRLCRHLIVLNPVSKSFELAHLTVREYLESRHEYRDGRPHALVAERCIKVFDRGVSPGVLDQYASLYWPDHYSSRPQAEENLLASLVEKFFHNKGVNPAFEKWAKLTKDSSKALPWGDNIARRLRDAWYKPLGVVCVFGFTEFVHQWMDTAPGYSYFQDSDDMVVHLAIKWGNKDVVRLFQRQDTPTIDKFGWTSWVWAAVYEQLPVLEELKELYGDANAQDGEGWTALHWMVFLGHMEGLKALLNVGAGPNIADEAKWTPLHWAVFLGRDAEAMELAVEEQGLNLEDHDGLTPFQWAEIVNDVLATRKFSTANRTAMHDSAQQRSAPYSQVKMD